MRKLSIFAALGVLVATASAWDARAQSQLPDQSLMFSPNSLRQTITPQATKQQATKPPTRPATTKAATKPAARPPAQRPVATAPRETLPRLTTGDTPPEPARPTIGRIPFETGTLGFTTDTKYKTMEFDDGRRTPGFENVQRKDSSYLGLSLSVPTDKRTIFPLPFLSRPD